mgnify:CR=1 FL=1|tara:strand:+ start:555 stop:1424 length:870 start_codon:yes stop_codon:yes gene_type:complete
MIVVGLGKAGCSIAKAFSKFPQYETFGIDTTKEADITIKARSTHEQYDEHFPNLKKKLKFRGEDILVATAGAGKISGGVLRLLEQLQGNNITILYIESDLAIMSEIQKRQERVVSSVLQEYARSGLLEKIVMVSNAYLEMSIGDMSIAGYYQTLNQAIINLIHMMNVFKHSEPVIGNFIIPSDAARICTIGAVDVEEDEDEKKPSERWFYPLTHARDVVYYYGIGEDDLKNDGTLLRKINSFVKSRLDSNKNVSYGVFRTSYEQKYCYCIKYSSVVQYMDDLLDDQDIG